MRILGLDIGDRRIGVAISDPGGILARPLTIVERSGNGADVRQIAEIIRSEGVGKVIAGLPRSLSGGEGLQAESVRAFTEKLLKEVDIALEFRDERLTSVYAGRLIREARTKKRAPDKRKKVRDDAIAAAIILEGYLDEKRDYPR
jgi:putative Holliday junction resolvase